MPNNKTIREIIEEFKEQYPLQVWRENNPDQAIIINPVLQKSHRDLLVDWLNGTLHSTLLTQIQEIEDLVEDTRVHIEREVVDPLVDFSKSFSEEDAVDSLRSAMNDLLSALKEKKDKLNNI